MDNPRVSKFKKEQKVIVKNNKVELKSYFLSKGVYGLCAVESGRITSKELRACRRILQKRFKGLGKVNQLLIPNRKVTAKPGEVRMGKGKGNVSHWVCVVYKGTLLFEFADTELSLFDVQKITKEAGNCLSLKVKCIVEKK